MKKYLFGMLAIVFAVGFSAFTKPKVLDNKFKLVVSPVGTNLEATTPVTISGQTVEFYTNWEVTSSYVCPSAQDKGCAIEISDNHTYNFGGTVGERIVKANPSNVLAGVTPYVMTIINGYQETVTPFIQYKQINPATDDVTNDISVKNRTTPHI